ncbi:MAG: hypothetical protein H6601_10730 [Flavobacteriales bacterium]|nr:hypothetical protein [Flavobacteriales bacterium]
MDPKEQYSQIVSSLKEKSTYKLAVLQEAKKQFSVMKEVAQKLAEELCAEMNCVDGVDVSYVSKGEFQFEIRFAEDVLIFFLHNDVFDFENSHAVWKRSYVDEDKNRAFCGMISVFNFLRTSFDMDRSEDIGYLISRIFINRESHYFVEGKRQMGFLYNDFGQAVMDEKAMRSIIMSAMLYCQEFDLLTPPFSSMSEVQVGRMIDITNKMNVKTGKRLGFQFSWDSEAPE